VAFCDKAAGSSWRQSYMRLVLRNMAFDDRASLLARPKEFCHTTTTKSQSSELRRTPCPFITNRLNVIFKRAEAIMRASCSRWDGERLKISLCCSACFQLANLLETYRHHFLTKHESGQSATLASANWLSKSGYWKCIAPVVAI